MPEVFGDRVRLTEVFQNLLENAIKFMGNHPEPTVKIGVRTTQGEVVCFVQDNGIGIAPSYHNRVFDLFDQLTPDNQGSGIGLTLAKRIVDVHGGRIWVESEGEGKGSTFFFTLAKPIPGNSEGDVDP